MRSTRPGLLRLASVAAVALAASGLQVAAGATAAHASCPTETYYTVGARAWVWLGTNEYSQWLGGPGTITSTITGSNTRAVTHSATFSLSISSVIAKAEASYGIDLTQSSTYSHSWAYSITIPAGSTARARSYKKSVDIPFTEWRDNPDCTTTKVGSAHMYAPVTSNANDYYCVTRDTYPGTTIIRDPCRAH